MRRLQRLIFTHQFIPSNATSFSKKKQNNTVLLFIHAYRKLLLKEKRLGSSLGLLLPFLRQDIQLCENSHI